MKKKKEKINKQKNDISLEQLMQEIRERANQIFIERGNNPGSELNDWLKAEKEIKKKYKLS